MDERPTRPTAKPGPSADQWWEAHSELDRVVATLSKELREGDTTAAGAALQQVKDALEGHFEVEERLYFPIVEQFASQHREDVTKAKHAHTQLRAQLDEIGRQLIDDRELAGELLKGLLRLLETHEHHEKRLIAALRLDLPE